jgi:imidazolonepropionase-like amidohydrolase
MEGTRHIIAGCLIDGSGDGVRRNVCLTVTDGRIAAIGPADEIPTAAGAIVDDYSYGIILPALVDCSVFLARSPSLDGQVRSAAGADLAQQAALLARHLRYCHSHGVLGVAEGDDLAELLRQFPPAGLDAGGASIRLAAAPSADGGSAAIAIPTGGDYLRIQYAAGIADAADSSPRLGPDDLRRLIEQRGGRKTVVVANGRQAVAEALAAGCDAIEQGYGMGEDNIRAMAAQGVLWIPGLLLAKNALDGAGSGGDVCCRFSQRYVAPGKPVPGAEAFWKKTLADQLGLLRQAGEAGVKTAIGTGAGNPGILHGESVVEEMKLFIKAGWSLAATIRCASAEGAEFFGMDGLGRLAVGSPATFLIARGAVQQLPRKIAYLEAIYIDGAPSPAYLKDPVRTTA